MSEVPRKKEMDVADVEAKRTEPVAPISPPQQPTQASQTTILACLFVYCLSGTLLTLVNKLAIVAYPFPNALLVVQNGITVLLLLIGSQVRVEVFGEMPKLDLHIIKTWGILVLLFVSMLLSSLQALLHVSATSLIVMRNLSTLLVALFERVFLGDRISLATWFALFMILFGAVLFGMRDMTFNVVGYGWLFVNVTATSSYQIYVKKLIGQSKGLGPFGMAFINNSLSLPAFLGLAYFNGEFVGSLSLPFSGSYTVGLVGVSSILGFTLSTTAFMMNKLITATSMMVANNVNKFAVIVLSEVFIERTLDQLSTVGTIIVMFFGWFYSKTKSAAWDVSFEAVRARFCGTSQQYAPVNTAV